MVYTYQAVSEVFLVTTLVGRLPLGFILHNQPSRQGKITWAHTCITDYTEVYQKYIMISNKKNGGVWLLLSLWSLWKKDWRIKCRSFQDRKHKPCNYGWCSRSFYRCLRDWWFGLYLMGGATKKKKRKKEKNSGLGTKQPKLPFSLLSVQSRELTAASAPVRTYCLPGFGLLCIPKQSRKPKLPLPSNNIVDFNLL